MRTRLSASTLLPAALVLAAAGNACGQSLAGAWRGSIGCDYNRNWKAGLSLTVTPAGPDSYTIAGSVVNGRISGTINSGTVRMASTIVNGSYRNDVTYQGSVSGSSMRGTYTQSIEALGRATNCTWSARKVR